MVGSVNSKIGYLQYRCRKSVIRPRSKVFLIITVRYSLILQCRIFRCVSRNLIGVISKRFIDLALRQAHTFRIHRDPRDFEKQFLLNSCFRLTLCYSTTVIMSSARNLPCVFDSLSKNIQLVQQQKV